MAGGKLRMARKATKGKGKKWKKGYSSSSNPETKLHRDNAKRGFFHYQGHSKLTVKLLAEHDASEGTPNKTNDVKEFESDIFSAGGDTFNTFATVFSECSNPSFDRLMRNWQAGSALHKEMLAIIAAVTEVIREKGGTESESEYFAALMTTLESVETEEARAAVITLLGMVMKRLPASVLKIKFANISKALIGTLAEASEHNAIIRGVIGCINVLLRSQELAIWNSSSTIQVYNVLLSFTVHSKPKVRKAAQHAVTSVLKHSAIMTQNNPPLNHPGTTSTAAFCSQKLQEANGTGGITTKLHVLALLKEVIGLFSKADLKTTCETILRLMTFGSPMVSCCSFQTLSGLFTSRSQSSLTSDLTAQLITALYDYQPSNNDHVNMLAWLNVMKQAMIYLFDLDNQLCLKHIVKFISGVVSCWLSDRSDVINAVSLAIKELLFNCMKKIGTHMVKIDSENEAGPVHLQVQKIVSSIENCLTFQYHSAWAQILQTIVVLFEAIGRPCGLYGLKILQIIGDLRDTHKFSHSFEVDKAFGMAIRTMGPKLVLKAVPFKVRENEDHLDFPKSWLIPILRDNVRETELLYFIQHFMPLAENLKTKAAILEKSNRMVEAKTCNILQSQIWAMLPGFCTKPTDLTKSFKMIAQPLGTILNSVPELRLFVLSALRLLVNQNAGLPENCRVLARFSKNYLPILFNLYTTEASNSTENSVRLAIYETIKSYLKITEPETILILFQKAENKLKETDTDNFNRHALLDLCRAILPYLPQENVSILFHDVQPLLENADRTIQKKSYRVLEEMCQSESEGCRAFVNEQLPLLQELFLGTMASSVASSKAPRLRCLCHIIQYLEQRNEQFMRALVSEAVLCTKISSEKARIAAYQLLVEAGNAEKRWAQHPKEALAKYIQLVLAGLAGNPHLISATVLALGNLFYEFKDDLSSEMSQMLIENVALLMTSKSREIVQSALAFFKTVLSIIPTKELVPFLPTMIRSLVDISEESQRHFRFKAKEIFVRFVRKFGFESIFKMVPESHRKMLNNIRKTEARKSRPKSEDSEEDDEQSSRLKMKSDEMDAVLEESDDAMSDEEPEVKNPKRKILKGKRQRSNQAWIQEGGEDDIVDFLDPSVGKKLLGSKPTQISTESKKIKHAFKTAPDGRLIITETEEDLKRKASSADLELDSITEAVDTIDLKGGRKRKQNFDNSDDELDQGSQMGGGKGIRRKIKGPGMEDGNKYKAQKAGGDIKKKGQLDPYAYIPLDRQSLNKRKRAKFTKHFGNVVKGAKKGANKGAKLKSRKKK